MSEPKKPLKIESSEYISLRGMFTKKDDSHFTEKERDDLFDKFIDWVEEVGLLFGGGMGLGDDEEE